MEYINQRARKADSLYSYIKNEVFVDDENILRVRHSGAPALKLWCEELLGEIDFDFDKTIAARKVYKSQRVKVTKFFNQAKNTDSTAKFFGYSPAYSNV